MASTSASAMISENVAPDLRQPAVTRRRALTRLGALAAVPAAPWLCRSAGRPTSFPNDR